ncbi:MAG: AIM24 family protein, partial [Oscillospiraceae bacterium]|nr:AIM24 family protein [Oscillospiraceae bacterium]
FLEIDGSVVEYDLAANESMLVDTGYLAAMDATCTVDIESVKGIGNALFGGEGLFNTRVSGPGHVWLQTMPISALAGSIRPYIPSGN